MNESSLRHWHHLTSEGAAQAAANDAVVVLPVSAVEQHGPHLPLSTDFDIGMGLLERAFLHLPDDLPAWVLPPQVVGTSLEHGTFAGTLSVSPARLTGLIRDLGTSLATAGIRRLVLSNSHGGNRHALDAAGLWLRSEHGMLVVEASYFRFPRPTEPQVPESEWRHGLHGGGVETAMMQYLRPDLVLEDRIRSFPSLATELEDTLRYLGPEGGARFSWLAQDLNPSGAVGDARLADPELGSRLVEYYGRVLADVIVDAREFPLARLLR